MLEKRRRSLERRLELIRDRPDRWCPRPEGRSEYAGDRIEILGLGRLIDGDVDGPVVSVPKVHAGGECVCAYTFRSVPSAGNFETNRVEVHVVQLIHTDVEQ